MWIRVFMSKCYYRSSVTNWCMQCTPTRKPTCLYLFSSSQHHLHSFPHHPPFFKPGEPCKCALGKPGGVLFLSLSLCLDPAIHGVMLMLRQRVCDHCFSDWGCRTILCLSVSQLSGTIPVHLFPLHVHARVRVPAG